MRGHERAPARDAGRKGRGQGEALSRVIRADPHDAAKGAHTLVYRSVAELRQAAVVHCKGMKGQESHRRCIQPVAMAVAASTKRIYSLMNFDSSPGATFIPFSFALVLQFDAMSARLRLCTAWALVCTSGESDRLRLRRRTAAADAGVARLDPLEENDRRLRGV